MTATEVLRRLLDERGVEWWPSDERWNGDVITHWRVGAMQWTAIEGEKDLWLNAGIAGHEPLTPEQAIAATLGSCNCSNNCTNGERTGTCVPVLDSERDGQPYLNPRFVCSECGCQLTESRLGKVWQHFCPNCGRRIEQ